MSVGKLGIDRSSPLSTSATRIENIVFGPPRPGTRISMTAITNILSSTINTVLCAFIFVATEQILADFSREEFLAKEIFDINGRAGKVYKFLDYSPRVFQWIR